jgi:Dynamin family
LLVHWLLREARSWDGEPDAGAWLASAEQQVACAAPCCLPYADVIYAVCGRLHATAPAGPRAGPARLGDILRSKARRRGSPSKAVTLPTAPTNLVGGRMPAEPDALLQALEALGVLADSADRERLAELWERLDARRLQVLVVGEAKRGKSTLVNALLDREVLPAGVTPLTAVATTVVYGVDEHAEVAFLDGRAARVPLADLADLVTERGNPGNRRGVAHVTVCLDAPLLARGVELVDTPGTGSVHEHNTAVADAAFPTMDAAVFVLSADPPVSASERDLLARVAEVSASRLIVLNKADYLDEVGLAEALAFTSGVVVVPLGGSHPGSHPRHPAAL